MKWWRVFALAVVLSLPACESNPAVPESEEDEEEDPDDPDDPKGGFLLETSDGTTFWV